MAAGGMVCIKYLLFFFNFIFWVSGIALIAVGALIKAKYGDFIKVSDSSLSSAAVFLIIIGVIVAIVGFLGCCGAYKENYCMVTTFAVLLAIIFILELAAGALAYAYKGKLEDYAKKGLTNGVEHYNDADDAYRKAMDKVQDQFKCCGVDDDGYTLYLKSNDSNAKFPESCCATTPANATANATAGCPETVGAAKKANPDVFKKTGCVKGFEAYLKKHLIVVGGVGIGIAFIQLIGIVFACCLMRSIKKEYEVM